MKRNPAPFFRIVGAVLAVLAGATARAENDGPGELAVTLAEGQPACQGILAPDPGVGPVLRVPLALHVGGSMTSAAEICSIAEEINEIMFAQAGICFEMEIDEVFVDTGNPRQDRSAEKRGDRLNLWLLSSGMLFPTSQNANGVFLGGADEAYSLVRPSLNTGGVLEQTRNPAARTGAHELGHALGLRHQDCGEACNNLLMRSGRRGFELVTGAPADTNEIQRARNNAMNRILRRGTPDFSSDVCAPPRFVVREAPPR